VLAGVEAALVGSTTGWPELLVAQLLHVYPGLRPQVGSIISAIWSQMLLGDCCCCLHRDGAIASRPVRALCQASLCHVVRPVHASGGRLPLEASLATCEVLLLPVCHILQGSKA
jgi:hypothetical protein